MKARAWLLLLAVAGGCWRADKYAVTAVPAHDAGTDSLVVDSPGIVDTVAADAVAVDSFVAVDSPGGPDTVDVPKDSETSPSFTIYVSPDGDDSNPGTLALPVQTVARARTLARAQNSAMTGNINVVLRGGTYPQTSTLTFTSADSGSNGFYVKYVAYPGERPLLTGGQPITAWKIFDTVKNIYVASTGGLTFRQLYVNGSKAIRARSPNLGTGGAANFYRLTGFDSTAHNVQVASSQVATWSNLTKVEMHLMTAWADNTLRIASISNASGTATIKFQSTEDGILFVRPHPKLDELTTSPARAFYFENALEMLDQPGEWYLDETTSVVYYKPRANEDMSTVVAIAPTLETILSLKGASTSDQVNHLWFSGLTFAHSTFMRPSKSGYLGSQAGQYNLTAPANNQQTVGHPPAGVSVTNAHHIRFERNLFTQMAATGLDLFSGTQDDLIVGNAFTDIGGNGISVGKFVVDENTEFHVPYNPTDKNEICTRETIANNYIANVTTEFQGAGGIVAGYPAYMTVEHNEVTATNSDGISVGYGWTSKANAMTNNRINRNHIHHVANLMAGASGITTLSNQGTGCEIQYNYLHDFGQTLGWADYAAQGIYLNEGTAGYTVKSNVMVNTPAAGNSPNTGSNPMSDNIARPPGADDIIAKAGLEADYQDIKNLTIPAATF
jgi:hypothetical protein